MKIPSESRTADEHDGPRDDDRLLHPTSVTPTFVSCAETNHSPYRLNITSTNWKHKPSDWLRARFIFQATRVEGKTPEVTQSNQTMGVAIMRKALMNQAWFTLSWNTNKMGVLRYSSRILLLGQHTLLGDGWKPWWEETNFEPGGEIGGEGAKGEGSKSVAMNVGLYTAPFLGITEVNFTPRTNFLPGGQRIEIEESNPRMIE